MCVLDDHIGLAADGVTHDAFVQRVIPHRARLDDNAVSSQRFRECFEMFFMVLYDFVARFLE